MKKVLVVGSGGREHTLAYKIGQSPEVEKVYVSPGNAGIAEIAECFPHSTEYIRDLAALAEEKYIDLTVVGPEDLLAMGIVDEFKRRDLKIVGPTAKAAKLESSKAFSKDLMHAYGIPTAPYKIFFSFRDAQIYVKVMWSDENKLVVKANGLAKGKGVIVPDSKEEALDAVMKIMHDGEFGDAGDIVVIEKRLYGPEASIMGLSDDSGTIFFESSQDYKPIHDGDRGPNTGGMGAYSPVPILTNELIKEIEQDSVLPTMKAMKYEGRPFRGVVYVALMLTKDGPKVLEDNVRFGDPEIQVVMSRLKSDIFPYLIACTEDKLSEMPDFEFDKRAAVGVVLASDGYPSSYKKGKLITGLDDVKKEFPDDVMVFHAGTKRDDGKIYTNGGRVMCVTALGNTIDAAVGLAYKAAGMIKFKGKCYRTDIGKNVLERGRV